MSEQEVDSIIEKWNTVRYAKSPDGMAPALALGAMFQHPREEILRVFKATAPFHNRIDPELFGRVSRIVALIEPEGDRTKMSDYLAYPGRLIQLRGLMWDLNDFLKKSETNRSSE